MTTSYTYRTVLHEKLTLGFGLNTLPDFSEKLGLFSHKLSEDAFKQTLGSRSTALSYEEFGTLLGYGYLSGKSEAKGSNQFMYIKLGVLLELLNSIIPKDAADQHIFTFDTTRGLHKYRTITDHISNDPGICILPRLTSLKETSSAITDSPYIVDIFVSITHILSTLDSVIDSRNELDILTYVERLLTGIEEALGGINAFELQFFEESQDFAIVDRASITSRTNYPQIKLTGTNSIVKEVNLVSKLSPSITAAIAISAQSDPYSTDLESTGFNFLNKGITDSVLKERVTGNFEKFKEEQDKIKSIGIARAELSDEVGELIKKMYFRKISGEANTIRYSKEDVSYLRQIFSNYYKFLIGIENNPSFSFIVPFELQLTLDGISGLQVMESFTIAEEILPYPYRSKADGSRVVFMITGLEHQVSTSGWDTKIKAQIFLDNKKPQVVKADLFPKREQEQLPNTPPADNPSKVKGNPLLKEVLKSAGYQPGTATYELALTIGTKEGWNPNANGGVGSRSYRNNNPGNLDFGPLAKAIDPNATLENNPYGSNRFAAFTTAELGAKALVEAKIKRWAGGNMPPTAGNGSLLEQATGRRWKNGTPPTFREFMYTYAPPNENNTEGYLSTVVSNLNSAFPQAGVTADSTIIDIIKTYG